MFFLDLNNKSKFILFYFFYLVFVGSIFVFSSSAFLCQQYYSFSLYFYMKQLIGIIISFALLFFFYLFPSNFFSKYSFYFFVLAIILNSLLFISSFRYSFHGVARWLNFFGLLFQPAEILKGSLLLYFSHLFSFYFDQVKHLLFHSILSLLISILLLYYQSDFGTTIIILGIFFVFLWNFFYQKKILFYFVLSIIFLILLLILMKPYRIMRILIFLDPWKDQLGSGFQIIQSMTAIYRGGYFGVGLGNSLQKKLFLPMTHSDFIFSIIVEEIGLLGGGIILFLILYFAYFFIAFALKKQNLFQKYYLQGLGLIIFFQTVINVGGVTGLIPLKGIGLPFMSYGISSLIGFGFLIGIALSILNENKKI